jgi:hypothetical protein
MLNAPSTLSADEPEKPQRPDATATFPQDVVEPEANQTEERDNGVSFPHLPAGASAQQLQTHGLLLRTVSKLGHHDLAREISALHAHAAPPPLPFVPVRVNPIRHLESDLKEAFKSCASHLNTNDDAQFQEVVENLKAFGPLFDEAYSAASITRELLGAADLLQIISEVSADPRRNVRNALGVGDVLAAFPHPAPTSFQEAYADFIVKVCKSQESEMKAEERIEAIRYATAQFQKRSKETETGIALLTSLASEFRSAAAELKSIESSRRLIEGVGEFLDAEPEFKWYLEYETTPPAQLLHELELMYEEGLEQFHALPESSARSRLEQRVFEPLAHLQGVSAADCDRFIEAVNQHYIATISDSAGAVDNFIASTQAVSRIGDPIEGHTRYTQYPLAKFVAANKELLLAAQRESLQEFSSASEVGKRSLALSDFLDRAFWLAQWPELEFEHGQRKFMTPEYKEATKQAYLDSEGWMQDEFFPRQAEVLSLLPSFIQDTFKHQGLKPNEQHWVAQGAERACWLAVRTAPDSYREAEGSFFTAIEVAENPQSRAVMYRLLRPGVFLDFVSPDAEPGVTTFLRERVFAESNPVVLRSLAQSLCLGVHLGDSWKYAPDAAKRQLDKVGIDFIKPYRLPEIREQFRYMQSLVGFDREYIGFSDLIERRAETASIWQRAYYDLAIAASGDADTARRFFPQGDPEEAQVFEDPRVEALAIEQVRQNALLTLGYSELDQDSVSYKASVISLIEDNLTCGNPRQWGEKLALLFELYQSDWRYQKPENFARHISEKAIFVGEKLLGEHGNIEEPVAHPAIDAYLDARLLSVGVSANKIFRTPQDKRQELLLKHDISPQVPRLEIVSGFKEAISPVSQGQGEEFLEQLGYHSGDIENPDRAIRLLRGE